MKITIEIKSAYGRNLAYPACDKSRVFADMIGSKTLTREALGHIEALGYQIETVSKVGLESVQ